MSFTESVKEEIIKKGAKKRGEKIAFLTGFLRASGSLYGEDGEVGFYAATEIPAAAAYALKLFCELFGEEGFFSRERDDALNKKTQYTVECTGEKAVRVLTELGVLSERGKEYEVNLKTARETVSNEDDLHAYLRGVFLGSGYATLPAESTSTGYHLEIVFTHAVAAADLSELLAACGVFAKIIKRKKYTVVYVKSAEEMEDFFAVLGLSKAVLTVTGTVVKKQMANAVNRRTNCDMANVGKTVAAAEKYGRAIAVIDETVGTESLSPDLRAVAALKRDEPDLPMSELAERLNLTKSGLARRLKKLLAIAENLG